MKAVAKRVTISKRLAVVILGLLLAVLATLGARAQPGDQERTQQRAVANGTIYVDGDATGANDGTSWGDAFGDLQDALDVAVPGDQIWVAEGTYRPTVEHGGSGPRFRSFQLLNGVALYGGFDPSLGDVAWEDRDWETNVTVLSGDIGIEGDPADNSFHVFFHPYGTSLDESATMDGFTVTGGQADGGEDHDDGAGMYNDQCWPTLANCTFAGNWASDGGGGMFNVRSSTPSLTNCAFVGNSARHGGGMYNELSSPTLTEVSLNGNSAGIHGGGLYNRDSSPALTNCTFDGNWAGANGGGMYNNDWSPTVSNSTFDGNSAGSNGGAMSNHESSPTVSSCTFSGNSAGHSGGAINNDRSSPVLRSCAFYGNSASLGGALRNSSSPTTFTNCTLAGNSASDSGGGMHNGNSWPTLDNCILWGNDPDEIYNGPSSAAVVTHSDIQGGYSGVGNIDANPLFVDPGSGDLHLLPCSPAIDAGDNAAPDLPAHDFDGDDRVINGTVDMGADEADFAPPATYSLTVTSSEGGTVTVPGEGTFAYGCGRVVFLVATPDAGYRFWTWDGSPVEDPASPSTIIAMNGDKAVTALFASGTVIYVDIDATAANDGTSWQRAFTDLQDALDAAHGDQIWVAEGTYLPSVEHGGTGDRFKSYQLKNGVALYGGFDPTVGDVDWQDRNWVGNVTILSGDIGIKGDPADNSYHVFYHPEGTDLNNTAILDGFTITGGSARGGQDRGGGMYNKASSPTLANCTFIDNSAANRGGGMYNSDSSPILTNCTFEGNSAVGDMDTAGGGMFNDSSSPTLTDCAFARNSAGTRGGGMYNRYDSSPALVNCVFSDNYASSSGGGMYNTTSSPTLTNCAFVGNSAGIGAGMFNGSCAPSLTNCTFTANSANNGGAMYNESASPAMVNCILWGDTPHEVSDASGSLPLATYSDIQGGYPGEGNIDADPLFLGGGRRGPRLGAGSLCIDAGNNEAPGLPPHDIQGHDRVVDGDGDGTATADMGVAEAFPERMHLPLVLRNAP